MLLNMGYLTMAGMNSNKWWAHFEMLLAFGSRSPPATVKLLKVHIEHNLVQVRAAQEKMHPEKRQFSEKYLDNLLAIGLFVPTEDPE